MADDKRQYFESRHVQQYLGISKDKLFHWVHNKRLIEPAILGEGRGGRNQFSLENLLDLALINEMTTFGIELNMIAYILRALRDWELWEDKKGRPTTIWGQIKSKRKHYDKKGCFLYLCSMTSQGCDFMLLEKDEMTWDIDIVQSALVINIMEIIKRIECFFGIEL